MDRRTTLGFILTFCGMPPVGRAQQASMFRLVWLSSRPIDSRNAFWAEFGAGMRELGWIEGRNFTVENLLYDDRSERLPALASAAVRRKFDLILCAGTLPALAAREATSTIPIVFHFVGDPVGAGLVASLSRPGGNITGLGGLGRGISGKMLDLLMEMVPAATRIAMVWNPAFGLHGDSAAEVELAARKMKLSIVPVELRSPDDLDSTFATIVRSKPDALLIWGQPFLFAHGARLAKLLIEQRLPAIIPYEEVAHAGLLMSYGAKVIDDARRLSYYVDRILKGANPGTLPVEQPSRFYLTINLKTAKSIGLTLPPSLVQRAHHLID